MALDALDPVVSTRSNPGVALGRAFSSLGEKPVASSGRFEAKGFLIGIMEIRSRYGD